MNNCIITRNGTTFDFACPHDSSYSIRDIAHALSNICRFNGHTRHFYSVAQHSVLMSHAVPAESALSALLYKSAQAFTGCLPEALSQLIPSHNALEIKVLRSIFERFGVPVDIPRCVYEMSDVIKATERRDMFPAYLEPIQGVSGAKPLEEVISPWFPSEAARHFLLRFKTLTTPSVAPALERERASVY